MKATDIDNFIELIETCGKIYNRDVKTKQAQMYFYALNGYSIEQVTAGIYKRLRIDQAMPAPVHIINAIKEIDDGIQLAISTAAGHY